MGYLSASFITTMRLSAKRQFQSGLRKEFAYERATERNICKNGHSEQICTKGFPDKTDGMYDPAFEHDNCGIGSVVNIKGIKTHETVENALKIVENLKHRAGKDAEGKTGDGVGILYRFLINFYESRKTARY